MRTAKLRDRVRLQYARVRNGSNGSAKSPNPKVVEFTVGSRGAMPGLRLGVAGMAPGEQKRFTLQPLEAYGLVQPALIEEIPRRAFPRRLALRVGKRLSALSKLSGRRRRVRVVEIKPGAVIVDGNHLQA